MTTGKNMMWRLAAATLSRISCCALCLLLCASAGAKSRYKSVYMFGFAMSFQDSVCVMTDIQCVDSAYIDEAGFLKERTLYAYQMENHLEEKAGIPGATCVVFWDEKRSAVEKQFARLRKKYGGNPDMKLQHIDNRSFVFIREEHIEVK